MIPAPGVPPFEADESVIKSALQAFKSNVNSSDMIWSDIFTEKRGSPLQRSIPWQMSQTDRSAEGEASVVCYEKAAEGCRSTADGALAHDHSACTVMTGGGFWNVMMMMMTTTTALMAQQ